MDPATMVVQALLGGAKAALGKAASEAVLDAYHGLKALLTRRLAGSQESLAHMAAVEGGSAESADQLSGHLTEAGAVDPAVLEHAQRLLALLDAESGPGGKFRVRMDKAQGVQVGDGNTQHNTFG